MRLIILRSNIQMKVNYIKLYYVNDYVNNNKLKI